MEKQEVLGGFTLIHPKTFTQPAEWYGTSSDFNGFKTAFGSPVGYDGTIAFCLDTVAIHIFRNGTWYEV